eukprot:CAMPEP_0174346470 /NCGR_PEP_ID=MMETSP0811_2-20130205/2194_1 /TAXON_ID=73025 ORGANISM="Eutreptiella gymnastica-like, Strain CCMP1594" /NCGR_SAMPLE_ID=MMETSP0811_2 /ASSEMBLY_ACC=CAM_ASM_000667 /LENGTH=55 /DNA_ID=CAMNT_0015471073 /DNA_START=560 /DNA_END=727 /DNA_ORIENTATION=+
MTVVGDLMRRENEPTLTPDYALVQGSAGRNTFTDQAAAAAHVLSTEMHCACARGD